MRMFTIALAGAFVLNTGMKLIFCETTSKLLLGPTIDSDIVQLSLVVVLA
jgi:hypothetical protein